MKIILVTGFLGSGKTTFLSHLSATNKDALFLINEFSSCDMDSKFFPNSYSIKGGSIFCKCKSTEFLETIIKLKELGNDKVIVECSGMLDPQNSNASLFEKLGDISVSKCICVADARVLPKILKTLPLTENQLKLSSDIILNKIDLCSVDDIENAKLLISKINPTANIFQCQYSKADVDIDEINCFNTDGDFANTSNFVSWNFRPKRTENIQTVFSEYAHNFLRIKGFFGGGTKYVDYDLNKVNIKDCNINADDNIVFIADINNEKNAQKAINEIFMQL